ncbi:MAG: DUF2892 domain-containing protein [Thermoflexibacter sp.]|jgi:hypothetical protein|nr:DUF2892 domain-containing protein [Thermoflexibacter sp.]
MKANVGKTDKMVRVLLALIIGGLGLFFQSWLGLIAFVPLLTGMINWCPLYSIFGINTCAYNPKKA